MSEHMDTTPPDRVDCDVPSWFGEGWHVCRYTNDRTEVHAPESLPSDAALALSEAVRAAALYPSMRHRAAAGVNDVLGGPEGAEEVAVARDRAREASSDARGEQ